MDKLFNSIVTIGWLLEELQKTKWCRLRSLAIFLDELYDLHPADYQYIYQELRPVMLYYKEYPQSQGVNTIITENMETLLNITSQDKFFFRSNAYIFVTSIKNEDMEKYFRDIWQNFGVFICIAINYTNLNVLIFNPLANSTYTRPANRLDLDFSWLHGTPDFFGRPLKVVYFLRPESFILDEELRITEGQDALVMVTLAEEFNATLQFMETSDGKRYGRRGPDGGAQGTFKDILEDIADITGNTHFLKSYGVQGLQYTHYVGVDRLCLLVPKARKIPNYVALFRNIHFGWLYAYMATCFFGLLAIRRIERILKIWPRNGEPSTITLVSIVYRIFIGASVSYHFNKIHEKVFITSFLLATVVISNYFQGMMTTIASSPSYEKIMNTLEDVRERGVLIVYSNHDVKSYLGNDDLRGMNFKEVSVNESIALSNRSDIGRTHRTYSVFTKKNINYNGVKVAESMHIVAECLVDYPLTFVVAQESPILESINKVLSRLVESGLYQKWTEDSVPPNTYTVKERKENTPDAVNIYELMYAHVLLGIGLAISLFTFLGEKIIYQKSLRNRID